MAGDFSSLRASAFALRASSRQAGEEAQIDREQAAREVAAMQFAGGYPIFRLAAEWERSVEWVERAIRDALLESIPLRDGGVKLSRAQMRALRAQAGAESGAEQGAFEFGRRDAA